MQLDGDRVKAYIEALKRSVDGLFTLINGHRPAEDGLWKGQFFNWSTLFYGWYDQNHDSFIALHSDETMQTAVAFHMRSLEWRRAARERGYPTSDLGPEPDPEKAKELEEALKKSSLPTFPSLEVGAGTVAAVAIGGLIVWGVMRK